MRLLRNLEDAGCDEAMIQKYLQLYYEGRSKEQYRLLSMRRAALLDRIHTSRNMVDCLDSLIYIMRKEEAKI